MRLFLILIQVLLTALLPGCSFHKETLAPGELDFLFFDNYTGLPEPLVQAVAFDSSGSVWAAARGDKGDELYRFQYGKLKRYRDEGEFPLMSIDRLAVTLDGYAWAAGNSGWEKNRLAWFDYEKWTEDQSGLTGREGVADLLGDSRNRLWVSQSDGIISLRDDGAWRHWTEMAVGDSSQPLPETGRLAEGRDRTIWCSSAAGLLHLEDDRWRLLPYPGNLRPLFPPPLAVDWADGVWCWLKGDAFDSPVRLKGGRWETYRPEMRRPEVLFPSFDGSIWMPADALYRLELRPGGIGLLETGFPFGVFILCLAEDWMGHVWIGTESRGLIRVNRRYIDLYTRLDALLGPV